MSERSAACGVQLFFPTREEAEEGLPGVGGVKGGFSPSPRVTKLTNARIAHLVHQALGRAPRETTGQMAARWGVTPRRLRQVLQRWRELGTVPVLDPRRRPPTPPLTEEQKRLLEQEWRHSPRGPTKLWKALARQGIRLPHQKVYLYAKSRGWTRPNPRKQKKRSRVRYERPHSGSLLHGDYHRTTDQHPYVILWEDDASRKVLAGGEFSENTAQHAIETLREAIAQAALWGLSIEQVNTDRGSEFFANPKAGGDPTDGQFQTFLREPGIRHVVSRVNNPQTNGKLERLWYEYDKHRWRYATLSEFIDWYNDQIHDALWAELFETPREAFQRKLPPEVLLGLHERMVEGLA
jgi:putative transposase